MPIYEYRCTNCGHELELLKKISDPVETQCPACKKETFQRLISAAGFQLKGTGWYETDFKNKKNPDKAPQKTSKDDGTTKSTNSTKKGDSDS